MASASTLTGLTLDQACSQPGIVLVRTNASLVNVSGNSTTNPKICTFSGLAASMLTSTIAHDTASDDASSSPNMPRTATGPVPIRNPITAPTASSSATDQICFTRSATIRPASGANRAIGSDRSRSKKPFSRSVLSPTPVFNVVNRAFCTMIPGSANIRYSCGEPEIAPPNTYVNSRMNITGWMLKSISSNGLCLICTSVRQASESVWRSP